LILSECAGWLMHTGLVVYHSGHRVQRLQNCVVHSHNTTSNIPVLVDDFQTSCFCCTWDRSVWCANCDIFISKSQPYVNKVDLRTGAYSKFVGGTELRHDRIGEGSRKYRRLGERSEPKRREGDALVWWLMACLYFGK